MPSNRDFDWKLTHLALFRALAAEDAAPEKPRLIVEHVGSQKSFEAGQELLEQMLDRLLSAAWAKKVGLHETSACRAFGFHDHTAGEVAKALLRDLCGAPSLEAFTLHAGVLAERYAALPGAVPGVLVHAVCTVDSGRAKALPFYFLLKCDFEDARTLADQATLVPSAEVLLEKLKKAAVYPYFDGFAPDPDRVKVLQASGDYFQELLELREPATAQQLITRELRAAAATRFGDKYNDYFVGVPDGKRDLFGEDRVIPLDDLMPPLEAKHVNQLHARAVRDKLDAPVKARITVDESLTVTLDLSALGKQVFVGQKGGQRFLILRGEQFITSGHLTSLDFLDVEQLDDVLAHAGEVPA